MFNIKAVAILGSLLITDAYTVGSYTARWQARYNDVYLIEDDFNRCYITTAFHAVAMSCVAKTVARNQK